MSDLRKQIREQLKRSKSLAGVSYDNRNDFYFKNVEDGIFQHRMSVNHALMFDKGSGSELKDKNNSLAKAKAIDSSSMLSYNFFHWVSDEFPLELFGNKYTQVFFEVRLKTLKSSNAPANIDVVLVDNEFKHALFVESKFLEYLITHPINENELKDNDKKIEKENEEGKNEENNNNNNKKDNNNKITDNEGVKQHRKLTLLNRKRGESIKLNNRKEPLRKKCC